MNGLTSTVQSPFFNTSLPNFTLNPMSNLNGWHRGERLVRQKLGYDNIPSTADMYTYISGEMPEQHSTFYTTRLQFLPMSTLDDEGRPWGSILAGENGNIGFVRHPKYNTLDINAKLWPGEPFSKNAQSFSGEMFIAGIGVEVSTRRRNKLAGHITSLTLDNDSAHLQLFVDEAIGNCPKYITLRELDAYPLTNPAIAHQELHLPLGERLPDEAVSLILQSDTVFLGTTYAALAEEARKFPSHLGINHRGGRPGFIRVKPSDGRTVVLPDFSGNRIMTSLGNVEATPLASLTFISFTTGDILYLTGKARNVYGDEARSIMPFQDTFTEIYVTGYTYVRDAFPARLKEGYIIQPSPYSPPVRLLAEEDPQSKIFSSKEQPKVLLNHITIHSPTLATFEFEASNPIHIRPGQAAIMDFSPLFGSRRYQHMSPTKPSLVNDDFIRTWTVSSASLDPQGSRKFSLTMREKPGGTVTGALFSMARKLVEVRPKALEDSRDLDLHVNLVGISGEFVLPERMTATRHLLWIAGGIGITPFLSMLSALAESQADDRTSFAITLLLSTREPEVMLSLIRQSLRGSKLPATLSIHLFTKVAETVKSDLEFTAHTERIDAFLLGETKSSFLEGDPEIYLCGPDSFEKAVRGLLTKAGVDIQRVHQEGFAY